jgi:hypothetical protein
MDAVHSLPQLLQFHLSDGSIDGEKESPSVYASLPWAHKNNSIEFKYAHSYNWHVWFGSPSHVTKREGVISVFQRKLSIPEV